MSREGVPGGCPVRVSREGVPGGCAVRVSQEVVSGGCPRRVSQEGVPGRCICNGVESAKRTAINNNAHRKCVWTQSIVRRLS